MGAAGGGVVGALGAGVAALAASDPASWRARRAASPRRGKGRVSGWSSRCPTMPVQSSPKRLRSTSSAESGIRLRTSRALSVPSILDSTKPSIGVSVIFCWRSRGSLESTSTRLGSPMARRTRAGSWTRRVASRISSPVDSRQARSDSIRLSDISSKTNDAPARSSITNRTSRTWSPRASSRRGRSIRPISPSTCPIFLRSPSTTATARSRSAWLSSP